jgi:hypothetical protein
MVFRAENYRNRNQHKITATQPIGEVPPLRERCVYQL